MRAHFLPGLVVIVLSAFVGVAVGDAVPDLVAHWKLDETSGFVADDSAGSADGTLVGFDGSNTYWTDGIIDGALELDGIDEFAAVNGISGYLSCDEITISAWVNLDDLAASKAIYSTNEWTSGSVHFQIFANELNLAICGTTWSYDVAFSETGRWYHVAGVYSNANASGINKCYVDGVEVYSVAVPETQTVDLTRAAAIGTWNSGGDPRFFDGRIDDVRIYSRMLSDEEIARVGDIDRDGILDGDNCPFTYNPGQEDANINGVGDACEGVLYVDDNGVAPYTTIQSAINASTGGNVIVVMPGRYVENINMLGKAITLRSLEPTNPAIVTTTIIDGGASGSVIKCENNETSYTVIDGFVITNGSSVRGGGIYNSHSSPTIRNCTFSGNITTWTHHAYGGAICNEYSSSTISNCVFSGNTTTGGMGSHGGAIRNWESPCIINNCIFSNNTVGGAGSRDGGAIKNAFSSPTITNCTFSGNTASGNYGCGGGMYNDGSSSPTVSGCTFSNNSSGKGGAMYNQGSTVLVKYSSFYNNTPDVFYGDISANSFGNVIDPVFVAPPRPVVTYVAGDVDGDGEVDMTDLRIMAEQWLLPTCPGCHSADLNSDGDVNYEDFAILANNIEIELAGDLDGDGDVDIADFAIFAGNWLAGCL